MQQIRKLTVLAVSPFDEDRTALSMILSRTPWELHYVRSCKDAWKLLHTLHVDIVITELSFPDGCTWRGLLDEIKAMRDGPSVIVCCRSVDHLLWTEVLSEGAYDLLEKPFDKTEVIRIIGAAANHQHLPIRQIVVKGATSPRATPSPRTSIRSAPTGRTTP